MALNVKIKGFDSGKASFEAMLNNKAIDICTVAQTPIMLQSFNRNDFVVIATMVYSDNDVKVLVRQDKRIIKEAPNYLDFIYMDALEEVKPEVEMIVRELSF